MTIEKRGIYIDSELIDGNVQDPIRDALGSYWYYDGDKVVFGKNQDHPLKIDLRQTLTRTKKDLFPEFKQTINLLGQPGFFEDFSSFKQFVTDRFPTGKTFNDHAFELTLPLSVVDREIATNNGIEYSNLEPVYNFYSKKYEDAHKLELVVEPALPGLYQSAFQLEEDVSNLIVSPLKSEITSEVFFTNIAKSLKTTLSSSLGTQTNLIFLYESEDFFSRAQEKKYLYPMYMDLQYSTGIETYFAQTLSASCLFDEMMSEITKSSPDQSYFKRNEEVLTQDKSGRVKVKNVPANVAVNTIDVQEWFETISSQMLDDNDNTFVFFGDRKDKKLKNPFKDKMSVAIFVGKLKELIQSQFRIYKELLNGYKSYSETVLYKISKYAGEPSGTPVQTIFVPNFSETRLIDYIDAQVKYGSKYTYVVTAYQLVLGTTYNYTGLKFYGEPEIFTTGPSTFLGMMDNTILTNQNSSQEIISSGKLQEVISDTLGTIKSGVTFEQFSNAITSDDLSFGEAIVDQTIGISKIIQTVKSNEDLTSVVDAEADAIVYPRTDVVVDGPSSVVVDGPSSFIDDEIYSYTAVEDLVTGVNVVNASAAKVMDKATWIGSFTDALLQSAEEFVQDNIAENVELVSLVPTEDPETRPLMARAIVTMTPSVKLYEINYTINAGRMMDRPPIAPDVQFIPKKDIAEQILLSVTNPVGETEALFVPISTNDLTILEQIKESQTQNKNRVDNRIIFSSDDVVAKFEVYRTTKQPKSYRDFEGKLLKTIETAGTIGDFLDTIVPNVTYFYTFRSVDVHGHISNPSPVFKFKMISDHGASLPAVEIITMKELQEQPYAYCKPMRRFLHIVPRLTQTILDEEQSELDEATTALGSGNNLKLGLEDEAIWNKKFKVRLTSKQSRRKIDLNVQFQVEHVKSEVETDS